MFLVCKYLNTLMISFGVFEPMPRPEVDTISKLCWQCAEHVYMCWWVIYHFLPLVYIQIRKQLAHVYFKYWTTQKYWKGLALATKRQFSWTISLNWGVWGAKILRFHYHTWGPRGTWVGDSFGASSLNWWDFIAAALKRRHNSPSGRNFHICPSRVLLERSEIIRGPIQMSQKWLILLLILRW